MQSRISTLVQEYGWVHTGLGATGNIAFLVGSIFFLPALEHLKLYGTWLFIIGASLMLVGSLGNLLVKIYEARESRPRYRRSPARNHRRAADERYAQARP